MRLTDNEKLELSGMRFAFVNAEANRAIGEFAQGITDLLSSGDSKHIHRAIGGIDQVKSLFQQMHNFYHTLGMIAAKAFLEMEFPDLHWEQIEFARHPGAPGPDLCIMKNKIVAELKTTEPCGKPKMQKAAVNLGSNQKKNFDKDLQKLSDTAYLGFRKYMFVTSPFAYHCLINNYRSGFPDITFVLLREIPDVSRPIRDQD